MVVGIDVVKVDKVYCVNMCSGVTLCMCVCILYDWIACFHSIVCVCVYFLSILFVSIIIVVKVVCCIYCLKHVCLNHVVVKKKILFLSVCVCVCVCVFTNYNSVYTYIWQYLSLNEIKNAFIYITSLLHTCLYGCIDDLSSLMMMQWCDVIVIMF